MSSTEAGVPGSGAGLRPPGRVPGAEAPAIDPAWRPWLRLLDLALSAAADPAWADAVPLPAGDRDPTAPLLHHTVARVNARHVRRLVRDLLRTAAEKGTADAEGRASLARLRARHLDTLALAHAGVVQDHAAIAAMADSAGASADALGVIAQLAALPFLHACAARLHARAPDDWARGYCPICAGWPTLVELRGLERRRRLRCGRCGDDWSLPVLHCAFCGETRHGELGTLLPEGEEQRRRVETCASCKGYLKVFATLRPLAPRALALEDLASMDLDLAAQERGFSRPARPGFSLVMTVERARRMPAALGRWR